MDALKDNKDKSPQTDNNLKVKIYKGKNGEHQLQEEIDAGAIGRIWKAEPINEKGEKNGKTVAIKTLHPAHFNLSDSVYWKRFEGEIENGKLLKHPNLVKVLDRGVHDNEPFLVMEYIEGKPLSEIIQYRKLNFNEKIEISLDIIEGLKEIHELKFVHRDLKPDNILITNEQAPRAIICDYGLLKKIEGELRELTEHDDTVGSNTYMSLHQRRNPSKADKGDDIYSLCLCLFEIFTGKKWHTGYAADLDQQQDKLKRLINEVINFDSRLDSLHSKSEEMRLKYGKEQKALIKEQKTLIKNIPENYSLDNIEKLIKAQRKPPSNSLIIGMLLIAILSFFTIFQIFFHKYALTINTTPPNAQVLIVNHPEMKYKQGMELKPGQYHIVISCEGFKTVDKTITVDRDVKESVQLKKLYCLRIKTIPEDAQVLIVKPKMEYNPGMELEPEIEYDIEISHSGFKTELLKITIPDDIKKKDGSDKEEYELKEVPQLMDNAIDIPREKFKFENRYGMKFVYIPPGSFMTSPENTISESQHVPTNIDIGFYIQTTEVTQDQWEQVMIEKPPQKYTCGTKENCLISPVTQISWAEAQNFIRRLNTDDKIQYRLPTEAEWEYACRARTETPFSFGSSLSTAQANHNCFDKECTAFRVASFSPNNWGLYDMHGNVTEWCQDIYQQQRGDRIEQRVRRGGAWNNSEDYCRSDYRSGLAPRSSSKNLGFRVVMTRTENTQ